MRASLRRNAGAGYFLSALLGEAGYHHGPDRGKAGTGDDRIRRPVVGHPRLPAS